MSTQDKLVHHDWLPPALTHPLGPGPLLPIQLWAQNWASVVLSILGKSIWGMSFPVIIRALEDVVGAGLAIPPGVGMWQGLSRENTS